jgi:U32 family peptidase
LKCGVQTVYCEFEDPKKYREAVTLFHTGAAANPQPQSAIRNFRRSAAHFQNGRGMDFETGPLLQRRRLSRPQLRSPEIFRGTPARGRLFAERGQPHWRRIISKINLAWSASRQLRFEFFAARSVVAGRAAGMVRGHDPPAHADVSHGALRVLRVPVQRHGLPNCGRPCDRHDVQAARPRGRGAPLKADAGCRNTVFNSQAQTGAELFPK